MSSMLLLVAALELAAALVVRQQTAFSQPKNTIASFVFQRGGTVRFKLHNVSRAGTGDVAICPDAPSSPAECSSFRRDCATYPLLAIRAHNNTFSHTIATAGSYSVSFFLCREPTSVEVDFTLRLQNPHSELPDNSLPSIITATVFLLLWSLTFLSFFLHNGSRLPTSSFAQLAFLTSSALHIFELLCQLLFWLWYCETGHPQTLIATCAAVFATLSSALTTTTLTLLLKGWLVVFESVPFRFCKVLAASLFLYTTTLLAGIFLRPVVFIAHIVSFSFLVPLSISSMRINTSVIHTHHLSHAPSPSSSIVSSKIKLLNFLFSLAILSWITAFICDLAATFVSPYYAFLVQAFVQSVSLVFLIGALLLTRPHPFVLTPIVSSMSAFTLPIVYKPPVITPVASNFPALTRNGDVLLVGVMDHLSHAVRLDSIALSSHASDDPLLH